jgi:hypothetical protein
MKKNLFATTAIVAAFGLGASAAHAQDASLNLGASSAFYANYTDQDVPSAGYTDSDYDFSTNTEFEIDGSVTLDNGITAGMVIEVEADNADGATAQANAPGGGTTGVGVDNIDENLIYLEGSFGRVEFGHEDGPADVMDYGATSVKAVYPGGYNNTTGTIINRIGGAPITPVLFDSGDGTKITYFTPRFAGLQFGVSLAPDSGQADPVAPVRQGAPLQDHFEYGANYVNSFNGFDLAASLTGNYGASPNPDTAENPYSVTGGVVLGFGGFEFGGSYGFGENQAEDELMAGDLGVGYSTGPWKISLTGFYSQIDFNGNSNENELMEGQLGVNYALGGGVSVFGTGTVGEHDNDTAVDNDYVSLLSGVSVSF